MVRMYHDHGFKVEDVYIVNKDGVRFRPGESAKVINTVWLTPEGSERRMCFHVLYEDGFEDYVVMDPTQFTLMTETEHRHGR